MNIIRHAHPTAYDRRIIQLAKAAGMSWDSIAESTKYTVNQVRYAGDLDYRYIQLSRNREDKVRHAKQLLSRFKHRQRESLKKYIKRIELKYGVSV